MFGPFLLSVRTESPSHQFHWLMDRKEHRVQRILSLRLDTIQNVLFRRPKSQKAHALPPFQTTCEMLRMTRELRPRRLRFSASARSSRIKSPHSCNRFSARDNELETWSGAMTDHA